MSREALTKPRQLDLPIRQPHRLLVVQRARNCMVCSRMMAQGTEAAVMPHGVLVHTGCADEFGGPGGR